ncbi:c-type cytochrome [Candidatus Spongiihabitans sp.]|uniref:c-type cytochrome n=1 Tax=Candidatus Spongiihabitans sp. TaxID=3101308 RepID=UPI003C6EE9EF
MKFKTLTSPALMFVIAANLSLLSSAGHGDAKFDFETNCTACHGFGVAGAPKLGDKQSWAPRIDRGIETLYKHAIDGFTGETGVMPPKGGFSDLSDDQLRAIVDYMVTEGQ